MSVPFMGITFMVVGVSEDLPSASLGSVQVVMCFPSWRRF
jgi:hypothetical protein